MKLERAQATGDEACSESFRQDGTRTRDVTVELHGISDRCLSIETVSSPSKLGYGRLTIVPIKFINASSFRDVLESSSNKLSRYPLPFFYDRKILFAKKSIALSLMDPSFHNPFSDARLITRIESRFIDSWDFTSTEPRLPSVDKQFVDELKSVTGPLVCVPRNRSWF